MLASNRSLPGLRSRLHNLLSGVAARTSPAYHGAKSSPLGTSHPANGVRGSPFTAGAASRTASGGGASTSGSLYDNPKIYSIAFGYREIAKEVAFVRAAVDPCLNFLELACGPASHCIELAKSGVRCVAVDLNTHMVRFAAEQAGAAGVAELVDVRQGDMRAPPLRPEEQGTFDAAGVMLGSLGHLLTNEDAARCLTAAAAALRPGGALVLELPHVGDLFDGSLQDPDAQSESWDREEDKVKVSVKWGRAGDEFDYSTQVLHRTVSVKVSAVGAAFGKAGAKTVSSSREVVAQRVYTAQEIRLLGSMCGLEVESMLGDFDASIGLTHEDAYRTIAVLRKK